jgi:hypothetical protein
VKVPAVLSFEQAQSAFIATLNNGPAALNPTLFAGTQNRVLLGLKAHANTISHARLIALEDSFPLTRAMLGDARFNTLSRQFCETVIARASDTNRIGVGFADFLLPHVVPDMIDLVRIEWAWLESYHSADATPLVLVELAALDETDLLELTVISHDAARLVPLGSPNFTLIPELGDMTNAAAILITRPDAGVRLLALDTLTTKIFARAQKGAQMCNLLEIVTEQEDDVEPLASIITLISAGALIVTEPGCALSSHDMTG